MRPREQEYSDSSDAAPIDMLSALFDARGWESVVLSDDELQGEVQGSWAKYQLRAIWRAADNVLQFLCLPDIRVSSDKRPRAYELLSLVNEQMWLGHFDPLRQRRAEIGQPAFGVRCPEPTQTRFFKLVEHSDLLSVRQDFSRHVATRSGGFPADR